ncbi:unnamed protein product [Pleuronectes platessa]|uniref:Uncharacterized protein n=1 Tax=Pleuronectes platessa TaxID=8262 RepID=A0A9N7YUT7_PLEPL|nr:unnamed protein product [Pleuronectes platessa]
MIRQLGERLREATPHPECIVPPHSRAAPELSNWLPVVCRVGTGRRSWQRGDHTSSPRWACWHGAARGAIRGSVATSEYERWSLVVTYLLEERRDEVERKR